MTYCKLILRFLYSFSTVILDTSKYMLPHFVHRTVHTLAHHIDTISFILLVLKCFCAIFPCFCVWRGSAHVCKGVCRLEVNLECHCSGACYLALRDRISHLPEDHWIGWLSGEPQVVAYCCYPRTRTRGVHHHSSTPSSSSCCIHPTSSSIMVLDLADGTQNPTFINV